MPAKKLFHRAAAAAAATVLVAVSAGPAFADRDHGQAHKNGERHATHDNQGRANPPRHTPVTVCHLLGNGSYNILTFDDSALKAHQKHGDLYPVPDGGCPDEAPADDTTRGHEQSAPGHTPVTVCHLLGNGSYNILTFDDHALKAHQAHGDLYPVPDGGCPATEAPEVAPTPESDETPEAEETPDTEATEDTTREPVVLGVEETRSADPAPTVAGTEATAAANRAAPVVGPLDGILPNTGAAPVALAAVAGLGLLGAGATVLLRRRRAQVG